MKRMKKTVSLVASMMLILAMALFTNGCNGNTSEVPSASVEAAVGVESTAAEENTADKESTSVEDRAVTEETTAEDTVNVLGEGETQFAFTVVDKDGNETVFEIRTDKETVGEALVELGLIEGEESEFGLYVKVVNGITADYDEDGTYWAFYINDEYAQTGADTTTITEGDRYSFKVEKG